MQTKDRALPVSERYIHAAISKEDFKLVVTLHPQLAKFIHGVLALAIDYTFKRIEGDMDEWEVVGFSGRFKCRVYHYYPEPLSFSTRTRNTFFKFLL
jgi:hypothetical protein